MRRYIIIIITLLISIQVNGQQFCTDLFGFRLGQYREAIKGELGDPFKSGKFEDGFEYEAFCLKPDTSLYIVFEYAVDKRNNIWSIQVSGSDPITDLGIKDAKLGINKLITESLFGKPDSVKNIGEYGQKWEYSNANYSLEISVKGKLSSIKIFDNAQELFPSGPDLKKIPAFDKIRSTLCSNNNTEILNLLSGDVEIYYKNNTYFLKNSFLKEKTSGNSKILSIIKTISKDLVTVNINNSEEYEENMRLTYGEDTKHVIKIKRGHIINEIVMKYFGGQYYIYEINADKI